MVRASDFWTIRAQTSIFSPSHAVIAHTRIVASVLTHFGERYSGGMEALPLPENIPHPRAADIPRVTLRSADDAWVLSVARSRIDSVWQHQTSMADRAVPENVIQQCAEPLLQCIQDIRELVVCRFALVQKRVAPCDDSANELINRFCAPEMRDPDSPTAPFRNSRNFQIHNLKRYALPESQIEVNSWVRCRTLVLTHTGTPVIECEQDINSPTDHMENSEFTEDAARGFFIEAERESDEIRLLYFPEHDRQGS